MMKRNGFKQLYASIIMQAKQRIEKSEKKSKMAKEFVKCSRKKGCCKGDDCCQQDSDGIEECGDSCCKNDKRIVKQGTSGLSECPNCGGGIYGDGSMDYCPFCGFDFKEGSFSRYETLEDGRKVRLDGHYDEDRNQVIDKSTVVYTPKRPARPVCPGCKEPLDSSSLLHAKCTNCDKPLMDEDLKNAGDAEQGCGIGCKGKKLAKQFVDHKFDGQMGYDVQSFQDDDDPESYDPEQQFIDSYKKSLEQE